MQHFNFPEVSDKMDTDPQISIRFASEVPKGKMKLQRDLQTLQYKWYKRKAFK